MWKNYILIAWRNLIKQKGTTFISVFSLACAELMGIGAPKLSQILSGKREPDVSFLKAAHEKLNIDAEFLLTHL